MWYIVLLPFILPYSSFLLNWRGSGIVALGLWILGQAAWLKQGYQLEFLGESTFFPGIWASTLGFFAVNCWMLGVFIDDIRKSGGGEAVVKEKVKR